MAYVSPNTVYALQYLFNTISNMNPAQLYAIANSLNSWNYAGR